MAALLSSCLCMFLSSQKAFLFYFDTTDAAATQIQPNWDQDCDSRCRSLPKQHFRLYRAVCHKLQCSASFLFWFQQVCNWFVLHFRGLNPPCKRKNRNTPVSFQFTGYSHAHKDTLQWNLWTTSPSTLAELSFREVQCYLHTVFILAC